MNKEQMKGDFQQLKGKIKQQWSKLTDDDIGLFNGKREEFLGKLQTKYGKTKEQAETEVQQFEENCGCSASDKAA